MKTAIKPGNYLCYARPGHDTCRLARSLWIKSEFEKWCRSLTTPSPIKLLGSGL